MRGESGLVYLTELPGGLGRREAVSLERQAGWALVRYGLKERGLEVPADMRSALEIGAHGKPRFQDGRIHFNISHSRGLAACALEAGPVGLDLERERIFAPGLAARICGGGEEALAAGNHSLLTQLWTCKEAHMKYTGMGMAQGIEETEVSRLGPEPRMRAGGVWLRSQRLERGEEAFWLTECRGEPFALELERVSWEALEPFRAGDAGR